MFEISGSGYTEDYERLSQLVLDMPCPQLEQQLTGFEAEGRSPVILSADSIPQLRASRDQARDEGWGVIEFNRTLQAGGFSDQVPLVVDPLGTAKLVVEAAAEFGESSPEHLSYLKALRLDTRRLVGEAKRKLTWESFPAAVQTYDSDSADFLAEGDISLNDLTYNGLSPNTLVEKEATRVEDWVEEKGTYREIGKWILGKEVRIDLLSAEQPPKQVNATRFSLCPDWAIDQYRNNPDPNNAYEGFVPENEKFVIRNLKFSPVVNGRQESQLAVSGKYITPEVMAKAINYIDDNVSPEADKQTINSTVMVTEADIDEWDWIMLLDAFASQENGSEIFMGELFEGDHKDYELAKAQAAERYAALDDYTDTLVGGIILLAKADIDPVVAGGIVETKLRDMLLEECKITPAKAKEIFNDSTAKGFERANQLEEMGRRVDAMKIRQITAEQAPAASFCGAGSCGLENVTQEEMESNDLIKEHYEPGDIVLRGTEQGCTECGKKKIIYVFNEKKVVKICEGCSAVEKTRGRQYGSSTEK